MQAQIPVHLIKLTIRKTRNKVVSFIDFKLFQTAYAQEKNFMKDLEKQIQNKVQFENAQFGIAFKNLQTGQTLFINEKANFHAASTMKTSVLVELFKQAKEGKFSMNDSIEMKNELKSIVDGSAYSLNPEDDSEHEPYKHLGKKERLLHWPTI